MLDTLQGKPLEVIRQNGSFTWSSGKTFNYQWIVKGDTKSYRLTIKRHGGIWNPADKTWHFGGDTLPDEIRALVKASPAPLFQMTEPTAPAPVEVETPVEEAPPAPQPSALITIASEVIPKWFTPPSWWAYINLYIAYRPATAIVGPAGNGKTTTAEIALKAQGYDYEIMSCTDRTEVVDLIGGTVLTVEGEQWRDGLVTKAFREGKAVVLDEADALDPRVMMSLQTALLDPGPDNASRFITTPEGKVFPAGKCPIVMTMNTVGSGATRQYVGRNRLDSATLDRISMLQTKYENEVKILTARKVEKKLATEIVKWAEQTRKKIDEAGLALVLSPRALLRIAQCVELFSFNLDLAVELEFYGRIAPDQVELVR